jgi:hypothetical protein
MLLWDEGGDGGPGGEGGPGGDGGPDDEEPSTTGLAAAVPSLER